MAPYQLDPAETAMLHELARNLDEIDALAALASPVGVGVGVHQALQAAELLAAEGIECTVVDLRTVAPLDRSAIVAAGHHTRRVVAVDEDYLRGGLTGEVAAVLGEAGVAATFTRVAVESTIPFARHLEQQALPNAQTDR
jgi:acetoin:2,6-dichlorophenolindophenol oxidoreductase subunit beta